jgi:hypothetical protein
MTTFAIGFAGSVFVGLVVVPLVPTVIFGMLVVGIIGAGTVPNRAGAVRCAVGALAGLCALFVLDLAGLTRSIWDVQASDLDDPETWAYAPLLLEIWLGLAIVAFVGYVIQTAAQEWIGAGLTAFAIGLVGSASIGLVQLNEDSGALLPGMLLVGLAGGVVGRNRLGAIWCGAGSLAGLVALFVTNYAGVNRAIWPVRVWQLFDSPGYDWPPLALLVAGLVIVVLLGYLAGAGVRSIRSGR